MFSLFEKTLTPTGLPERPEPPGGLLAFYWHFARQAKGLFIALFVIEFFVALLDTAVPWFIGRIVTLVTSVPPDRFLAETWPWLVGMALVVLVARPGIVLARYLITNQAIAGPFTNLIRWQSHWHVVRQSWAFFQNDFAGRISNRVMQTGPALRESLVASVTAVWYVDRLRHHRDHHDGGGRLVADDPDPVLVRRLYRRCSSIFVPRMRDRSKVTSEARSALMGRIVDSYTNILTVKLFARPRDEDDYVRDAVEYHTGRFLAAAAADHRVRHHPRAAQRACWSPAPARIALVLWRRRRGRGRHHRHGAAADLSAHQHVALDRLLGHRDLRGDRRRAGGHDHDRAAAAADRPSRRASR